MTAETTDLPMAARALFVGAGIDLAQYDNELQFARIEATYDEKGGAA